MSLADRERIKLITLQGKIKRALSKFEREFEQPALWIGDGRRAHRFQRSDEAPPTAK